MTVLAHFCEIKKPTNTAKLAARVLAQCRILQLGALPPGAEFGRDAAREAGAELTQQLAALDPTRALLLYPSDEAIPLDELMLRRQPGPPLELLVPDGTWAATRRLVRRYPELQRLQAVRLCKRQSTYALRRNAVPGLLCTLEAIACALGVLDGADVEAGLLSAFDTWQTAALAARHGQPLQSSPLEMTPELAR